MFKFQARTPITSVLHCVIAAGLAAVLAAPALAQNMSFTTSSSSVRMMSPGSFRNLMRPDYSRRDLKLMFSGLDIDQNQRYVLEILMDGYTNQFNEMVEEFKDVRDRYEWPRMSSFGHNHAENFTEDILHNLDNAQVIQLEGDGIHMVGLATTTIDIGDAQTGVFISGQSGAAQAAGGTLHSIVMIGTPDGEAEGENILHTIPPEVLEKLKENLRNRLEVLLEKYKTESQTLKDKQKQEDDNEEDVEKATADEVAQAARKLRDEKALLALSFISDLELLLSESQLNAWPATDRTLRRVNTIPHGEFAGEKLDLVRFVTDYPDKPSSDQKIDSILNQYKLQLDIALKERNDYLSDSEIENFIAFTQEDNDEILDIMRKESDLRVAVRTVNDDYLQNIASLLDDEKAAEFQAKAKKEAHKFLYRPTRTQRLYSKAAELEDLDETLLEAIETLSQRYLQELEIANDRLADAIHMEEPKQKMQMAEMMANFKAGEGKFMRPPTSPMHEGYKQRIELGKRYKDQLKSILSDEQFEAISPKFQFSFTRPTKQDSK
ncbi:MAG: hypothetical protein IH984_16115 [Planctomycetes bacterium]|nr:hypothetical protein [Planctomycetota bacterium]